MFDGMCYLLHQLLRFGLVSDYNFSHRIMHFSYGSPTSGVVNPLDGEEKVTTASRFLIHL